MQPRPHRLAALITIVVGGACAAEPDPEPGAGADAGVPSVDAAGGAEVVLLQEAFAVDGDWPAGWSVLGGVAGATVVGGRGQLTPVLSDYSLARMGHALPAGAVDVEVTFTMVMSDGARQGVGVGVRHNGGYLRVSSPRGSGYAVFVESFRGPKIGVWRELDGIEAPLAMVDIAALADGAAYAVRFRCTQDGGATLLAAKLWPAESAEPTTWSVAFSDPTPTLQGVTGALAVDAWNTAQAGGPAPAPIFIDDLVLVAR